MLLVAITGAAIVVFLGDLDARVPDSRSDRIRLVALAILLAVFLPVLFSGNLPRNLRNFLVWMVLFGMLFAGHTAWRQSSLGTAALTSEALRDTGARTPGIVRFRANRRGDYVVRASVDGVPVTFLVDTGASQVVLSRDDARRVGIDPDRLAYVQRFQTANGLVLGAPVHLGEISIGDVRVRNVRGSVTDSDLGISLLGMSFINRLSGFEMVGGTLTLRE